MSPALAAFIKARRALGPLPGTTATRAQFAAEADAWNALVASGELEPVPGGDMPAPFPGMWVRETSGVTSEVTSFWHQDDGWYFDVGDDHLHESDVTATYDGRREIWRRA